ncbi:RNA-directed DNA polymerase from mobile element jockey [Eumeta japonica]|uniref:RNA-directed DNA polymerase from mobile element jockey n=1 Tax=Eumeta variegata TaxID=151549 RepID=A0A4C1VXJ0_EUMVA|nr:RNA-directed DNA polymerase from mobile element jockey [Eumeta japonica]
MANAPGCSATISIGRHKPKSISLISFNARGLESNILELGKCATEYSADTKRSKRWYCRVLQKKTLLLSRRYPPANKHRSIGVQIGYDWARHSDHSLSLLPPHKPLLRSDIETLLALGDAVILFGDLNSKNTDWRSNTTNTSGRMLATLAEDHDLAIIAPLTPTYLPANVRHRPNILDLAILKGVVLSLNSIETVHCLGSDHLPVLLKLGPSTGENQNIATKTIIDWKRVSTALEEVDTPNLNVIPDDIVSNNDIDTAIGALTKHIRSVVKRCQRKVPRIQIAGACPRTFAN